MFRNWRQKTLLRLGLGFALLPICLLAACRTEGGVSEGPAPVDLSQVPSGMTEEEAATLASLVEIDDYPLYTMVYQNDYSSREISELALPGLAGQKSWSCSLFAVLGDPENMLLGRNFDWDFSPGLLLFTDPLDGYASVSMVDLAYLGFAGENAFGLTDLPLESRAGLLDAPFIPFDGMNEAGLAVGMAAVPSGTNKFDPDKETVDSVRVIRMVLDQAATVEEAVQLIGSVNIDMGGNYLHYLIAEKSGRSVLVEFGEEEMIVLENSQDWQAATNFLVFEAGDDPGSQCWRYSLISSQLSELDGELSSSQALALLERVAQEITQWSVVYEIKTGEIRIAMGGKFEQVHQINSFLME